MNTYGFTLIELVAIIIILAAIFLVSFPSFLNMSKAEKKKQYADMVDDLCLAGETYIYANASDFPELKIIGSHITVKVSELFSYGNVRRDTKNVNTGKSIEKDVLVYNVLNDYSLDCQYKSN